MTRKQSKRKRMARVYWMRVEIEPDYSWPDELMVDAEDDVRRITHVIAASHMTQDTLMANIEQALHAEVTECSAGEHES